jgi:hypothetical protein
MAIKNIAGLTVAELNHELKNGAKFVVYQYCYSLVVVTFKRGSNIYFIKQGESAIKYGLLSTFISLIFGWWGLPWGPIYTIGSVYTNFRGGKDVTAEVLRAINSEERL